MNKIKPKEVKVLDNYILEIKFSNGEIRNFDCIPYLNGDWFSELLDTNKFNTVRVVSNTLEWATGQDLCPDCLYDNSF
jgi:hypothetical protein